MRSWARISGHGFRPQFPAANEVNIVFSSLRSCDNSEVTPKLWSVDVTVTYLRVFTYIMLELTWRMLRNCEVVCPKARKQVPRTKSGQFVYHMYLCKKASDTGHLGSGRA